MTVPTAHRRFSVWTEAGLWRRVHRAVLDELGSQGLIDWSRVVIDATSVRAKRHPRCPGARRARRRPRALYLGEGALELRRHQWPRKRCRSPRRVVGARATTFNASTSALSAATRAVGGSQCAPYRPARAHQPGRPWHRKTVCRSRYRAAGSGLTANTEYPAAISAALPRAAVGLDPDHGISSMSVGAGMLGYQHVNRAIPSTPSGSRTRATRLPAGFINSTSWWTSAQSSPTNSN